MIPLIYPGVATERMRSARAYADRRRVAREAAHAGVIDAVGHSLIAIGTRLVNDPPNRRAA